MIFSLTFTERVDCIANDCRSSGTSNHSELYGKIIFYPATHSYSHSHCKLKCQAVIKVAADFFYPSYIESTSSARQSVVKASAKRRKCWR